MKPKVLLLIILVLIPIATATRYFYFKFNNDITIICQDCDYFISCNSSSMYPVFDCNDTLIAFQPHSKKDIQAGDIIWFRSNEYKGLKNVVHRVVGIDYKNCYITKGDNNDYADNYTPCFYDVKFVIKGVIWE